MQDIFDRLVQLLSPFGFTVRVRHEQDTRMYTFFFDMIVRADASGLKGKRLTATYTLDDDRCLWPPIVSAEFIAEIVVHECLESVIRELPAAPHAIAR